ncbi:MAG: hypothetical protein HWE14_00445 [Flavobacteriia bacterium]|nr:hypothetical protein [Flavobacteriia bacterium]
MKRIALFFSLTMAFSSTNAQDNTSMHGNNETIAVLSMDSRGINIDNIAMGNLVRLELEKTQRYEVMDKYDVAHEMEEAGIDASKCFGKNQLVEAGKVLKAQNMLTGSVEKFGDKIIYTLRLIDVEDERIEKTTVIEFVFQIEDIQTMTELIIKDILDIEYDPVVYDMLANFERPITNDRTSLSLDGPRFGIQFLEGRLGERLSDSRENGGLGMAVPMTSVFGYQWETQYISRGDFQALFEFIPTVNAIETGTPSFSLTILHGMRYDGWELGFGPAFRVMKLGQGYFDENNNWNLANEVPDGSGYELVTNFDARGDVKLNTGLIVAIGKTFRNSYINVPVNLYWSPSPQLKSNIIGLVVGFNIANSPVRKTPN